MYSRSGGAGLEPCDPLSSNMRSPTALPIIPSTLVEMAGSATCSVGGVGSSMSSVDSVGEWAAVQGCNRGVNRQEHIQSEMSDGRENPGEGAVGEKRERKEREKEREQERERAIEEERKTGRER